MHWFVATFYDGFMKKVEDACLQEWRKELLAHAKGKVLELGAGTGVNLPLYSNNVVNLILAEPDYHMRKKLEEKAKGSPSHVEVVDASAEKLEWEDNSFDCVVSTLVLCSVQSPQESMQEVHRILKPGGKFLFIEHVAAEQHPERLKWQKRIEPFWKRTMGNCHLTRTTANDITLAGLEIQDIQRESMRKALPFVRPTIRGIAHKHH